MNPYLQNLGFMGTPGTQAAGPQPMGSFSTPGVQAAGPQGLGGYAGPGMQTMPGANMAPAPWHSNQHGMPGAYNATSPMQWKGGPTYQAMNTMPTYQAMNSMPGYSQSMNQMPSNSQPMNSMYGQSMNTMGGPWGSKGLLG